MKTVCIMCKKEVDGGVEVVDDIVIRVIRKIKTILRVVQGNRLVVCKDCLAEHAKRRAEFEKTVVVYGVLATLIFLVLIFLSPRLPSVLSGIIFAVFIMSLALIRYVAPIGEKKV